MSSGISGQMEPRHPIGCWGWWWSPMGRAGGLAGRAETSPNCSKSSVAAVTSWPLWMVSSWWRGEGSPGESGARTRCRIGLCISAGSRGSTQGPLLLGKSVPTSTTKQTTPFTISPKTLVLDQPSLLPLLMGGGRVFILFSVTMSEVHITHDALEQG